MPALSRVRSMAFQSTPSTRRETLYALISPAAGSISIHSLHTEGDYAGCPLCPDRCYFNPLPPHGGRQAIPKPSAKESTFQSTPSTRRETASQLALHRQDRYFNPLPPHGGRPLRPILHIIKILVFQSTPSTRRETELVHSGLIEKDFNPLPPHGGRPEAAEEAPPSAAFQSTPSTRRETFTLIVVTYHMRISIHSLHTEGDGNSVGEPS